MECTKRTRTGFAYFYCDYRDPAKRDPHGVISSITAQIGRHSDSAFRRLWNQYQERAGSMDDLVKVLDVEGLLKAIFISFEDLDEIIIVIDALDECDSRLSLVQYLVEAYNSTEKSLKILVTSRIQHDIESKLSAIPNLSRTDIRTEAVEKDIELYVQARVQAEIESRPNWLKSPEQHAPKVIARIVERADGM